MTTNERIAEWAGWKPPEDPNWGWDAGLMFHSESGGETWYDTKLQRDLRTGVRIPAQEVHRKLYWTSSSGNASSHLPAFDTDITLWHGEDGLLAEIVKRKCLPGFLDTFLAQEPLKAFITKPREGLWIGMQATPARLAATLVKVIEEECPTG